MLIWSGILSCYKGVWGRLFNCVFSLCGPWECDFFVPSRFKHIPVKPWILWALTPCIKKNPMDLLILATRWGPGLYIDCYLNLVLKPDLFFSVCGLKMLLSYQCQAKKKLQKEPRWCTTMWFLSVLSPYPCMCLHWDLWMWRWSILATQDDSQDRHFGHLDSESSLGNALSALEDLWLSLLHMGDQPHLGKNKVPGLYRGSYPEGCGVPCLKASLLHLQA